MFHVLSILRRRLRRRSPAAALRRPLCRRRLPLELPSRRALPWVRPSRTALSLPARCLGPRAPSLRCPLRRRRGATPRRLAPQLPPLLLRFPHCPSLPTNPHHPWV